MSILHRPPSKGHVHKIRRLLSANLRYSNGSFTAYMARAAACEGGYDITIKKRCRNGNRKRDRCVLAQKAELFRDLPAKPENRSAVFVLHHQ